MVGLLTTSFCASFFKKLERFVLKAKLEFVIRASRRLSDYEVFISAGLLNAHMICCKMQFSQNHLSKIFRVLSPG